MDFNFRNKAIFQGSIQIIGVLNDTCVEVYKIFEGNKFVPVYFDSIGELGVLRFFQRFKIDQNGKQTNDFEDLTGYYVNSSRPVRVKNIHFIYIIISVVNIAVFVSWRYLSIVDRILNCSFKYSGNCWTRVC